MCINFCPSSHSMIQAMFGLTVEGTEKPDIWPPEFAPIILLSPNTGERLAKMARFGLLPPFAKGIAFCKSTYNCRSETAAEKPSFKQAWAKSRFCLVPTHAFMEPYYEPIVSAEEQDLLSAGIISQAPAPTQYKKSVPWAIGMADGTDFAIGGLWSWWKDPANGEGVLSFTMLTVNADNHAFMKRFHAPGEEKRMPFIVRPEEYETWLSATPEIARAMIEQFDASKMTGVPAPRVSKKKAA